MLEKIKSTYFLIELFSYLTFEKKLKIIKYNKRYQSNFNLNIIDYRLISGRYIKYETETKAKECDDFNNLVLFEGEYLNGQRNGKGKELDGFNTVKFEGEYKNGKRNGKGKEYNNSKNFVDFEGEYINGKRNGKGAEYYYLGQIYFDGEYLNGEKWKGKKYSSKGKRQILKICPNPSGPNPSGKKIVR